MSARSAALSGDARLGSAEKFPEQIQSLYSRALRVKPYEVALLPEPGHLALGEAARIALGKGDRIFKCYFTPQMRRDLPVADGLERRALGRVPGLQQRAHFTGQPGSNHHIEAPVDSFVEFLAIDCDSHRYSVVAGIGKSVAPLMRTDWLAGQLEHFERAHDPI